MVLKGRHTFGIFSHKLTDSTDVLGSKPIAGSRGQPLKCIKIDPNKKFLFYLPSISMTKKNEI